MRTLTDHIVSKDQAVQLKIEVMDEHGRDGANRWYEISDRRGCLVKIIFQDGPIKEVGINGITNEALIAIVLDRLCAFQNGPYANKRNQNALDHGKYMLYELQARTRERIARGVEGTHEK